MNKSKFDPIYCAKSNTEIAPCDSCTSNDEIIVIFDVFNSIH